MHASPSSASASAQTSTASERERQAADLAERERVFELNPKQYDFVYDDTHKFVAYIGGIGGGKSFAGAVKALRRMIEQPGSLGLIGAPTYPMLRDATMRSVFDIIPRALFASFNKSEGLLRLKNGSEALFRSSDDPDSLRGPNYAWFWLDEAPLCGYYVWKVMKGRLRQSGYATQGWVTGSPHGQDGYYEDFERDLKPAHKLYRASTYENAHNLPPHFIEDLGYTGQFALQEIEGLFVSFEGLVYAFRQEWHVAEWATERPRPRTRIGGVDWGFTNPAVALPLYVDGDDRAYVLDEFYERQAGFKGVSAAIVNFTQRYGIQTWYCGPDEPEHISELNALFGREHLPARAVAASDDINPGLDTVRRQLALRPDTTTGLMLSARCAQTRAEFRTYCYPAGGAAGDSTKRDPQEKPVKKFDHALDALRYCLHSALGGKTRHRDLPASAQEQLLKPAKTSDVGGIRILKKDW
jgi:phage terminase large subunit-like protein